MIGKNAKILLAALSTVVLIPLTMTGTAYADELAVENKDMYEYLTEILDRKDFEKSSTIKDVEYTQTILATEANDGSYNVTNNFAIVKGNDTTVVVMDYHLKPTQTGIEVYVPDQPKLTVTSGESRTTQVSYRDRASITNVGYVVGSWPATVVAEAGGTINNGFLSGSDSYTQTCWNHSTTWSMSFSADTTWMGTYSSEWRNINWAVTGERIHYA